MFTEEQKDILKRAGINLVSLTEEDVFKIAQGELGLNLLSDEQLIEFLRIANATYRGGVQIISDADYDFSFIPELRHRQPRHPFLREVEPELAFTGKTVQLPVRMLSTDKAYSRVEIERWVKRVKKAAIDIGINPDALVVKVTPKLDGFAAYDDGFRLYTRGDSTRGTDITRVFERGLKVGGDGKRGHGAGEIVVDRKYFSEHLSNYFENSRNFVAAILAEKKMDERVQRAIDSKAALFLPFSQLPAWENSFESLLKGFDEITAKIKNSLNYDIDGAILEIKDKNLKQFMGSTLHHHRWQIAFKENVEKAVVNINRVVPQTSRSGRVNPIAEVEPTRLSGATISRVTAHHYGMVKEKGIGVGAVIELVRSGLVIPKIENVIVPVKPEIPEFCPSCGTNLVWDKDYLYCPNTVKCSAQLQNTIEHFFKTLGNIDGFGAETIRKLYLNDIRSIFAVYELTEEDFTRLGFGEKTANNLVAQLIRSRTEPLDDWRFLSAFGVFRLGTGTSQKLLQNYELLEVFNLNEADLEKIEGFAGAISKAVVAGLLRIKDEFMNLYNLGFNLQRTPLITELRERGAVSIVSGKQIVFTGEMEHGTRADMEAEARRLGAKVGSSVTKKTDILVSGMNPGLTKVNAAKEKGVKIMNEKEYLNFIKA